MRIFVLGHTGFIGKAVYDKLNELPLELVGVNSKLIDFNGKSLIPRKLSLVADLETLIQSDSVIINASWFKTGREFRNSERHTLMAESEISLIQYISKLNLRYISLGSIAEIPDLEITDAMTSNYAINKRKVFEFLKKNYDNFAWMRVASCFGRNDKRSWIINELKNSNNDKPIIVKNPNNLINLSSVENISDILLDSLSSNVKGEFNLMDRYWYKIGDLTSAFYEDINLNSITRLNGDFSENDPRRILTGNNDVLEFLRNSKS